MKNIYKIILGLSLIVVGCQQGVDIDVSIIPDKPFIKSITLANMDSTGIIRNPISQTNVIDTINFIDSVFVKDRSVNFSNIWAQASLEEGCTIEPLGDSPAFGKYGDFSKPTKYKVISPTGRSAEWTVVVDFEKIVINCKVDNWVGNIFCSDGIWSSYSPGYCTGTKVSSSCDRLNLTFPFWDDEALMATFELELGDYDPELFSGKITLLDDVHLVGSGYDVTFHKGDAGTYSLLSGVMELVIDFSGYDIGDDKYKFTIKGQ